MLQNKRIAQEKDILVDKSKRNSQNDDEGKFEESCTVEQNRTGGWRALEEMSEKGKK